ncbi:MAG: hypothetical protein EP343_25210 [Deltaproteobacteria bacterium]|nr:MAG: hypothetical protein EP343_25210 [Deltaproteobacteria bacterium]
MRSLLCWIVVVSLWGVGASRAEARPSCAALFQQTKFAQAGACFEQEATKTESSSQPLKIKRFLQGRMLRNAAAAFRKASQQDKQPGMSLYWKERAVQALQQYLTKKLCRKVYRCRLVQGELFGLNRSIQYAQLTVQTGLSKALVVVRGVRFSSRQTVPPIWNQQVRPGRYKVSVSFGSKSAQTQTIEVKPGTPAFLQFAPAATSKVKPKVRPRIPPAPVVRKKLTKPRRKPNFRAARIGSGAVLGLGVAGLALGLGFAIAGHNQSASAETLRQQLDGSNLSAEERAQKLQSINLDEAHNNLKTSQEQAGLWIPMGWTFASVGLVGVVVGTVGLLMHRHRGTTRHKKPPKQGPPDKRTMRLFFR